MKRSLLLLLLVVPVTLADDKKDPVAEEKEKLKGMWLVTGVASGGIANPKNGISIFEISDDRIRFYRAKKEGEEVVKVKESEAEFSYKLDPSKKPKQIDITHLTKPAKGTTQKGIYALKGGELRLDVFLVAPDKERPSEFSDDSFILERVRVPDAGKK